jgi:hypothetical protein
MTSMILQVQAVGWKENNLHASELQCICTQSCIKAGSAKLPLDSHVTSLHRAASSSRSCIVKASTALCLRQVKDKAIQRGKAESTGGITAHIPDVFRCCCGVPNQDGRCREPHGKRSKPAEDAAYSTAGSSPVQQQDM